MLPVVKSILGHSKMLVLSISFFSLILVSAFFANRSVSEGEDQSVKGIETVNIPSPTPTPKPARQTYQWRPAMQQQVTSTSTVVINPTPTPIPAQSVQPGIDQATLQELQPTIPPSQTTTTTQVSCTFTDGTFQCQ